MKIRRGSSRREEYDRNKMTKDYRFYCRIQNTEMEFALK